jgi:hypothetical protein
MAVLDCDRLLESAGGLLSLSAVVDQAVASTRWPGMGRVASAAASLSMAALSCFCSSMNAGTGG